MERIERIHALHRILSAARYPVTVQRLQEDLECSRATVYRDLAYLRDYLMAPVVGNGEAGFRYDHSEGERFELPGLWLSSEELHSLLAAQQLLVRSGGGVLSNALAPLQHRIEKLLDEHAGGRRVPVERVRVIPHRTRKLDETAFRIVATAVLDRKQLSFEYRARSTDEQHAAHGVAAAPHPLPRELVPRRLGPRPRGAAQLRRRPHQRGQARRDSRRATCPTRSSTATWPPATASSPARPRAGRRSCSAPRPRAGWPTSTGIRSSRGVSCPTAATN